MLQLIQRASANKLLEHWSNYLFKYCTVFKALDTKICFLQYLLKNPSMICDADEAMAWQRWGLSKL